MSFDETFDNTFECSIFAHYHENCYSYSTNLLQINDSKISHLAKQCCTLIKKNVLIGDQRYYNQKMIC